MDSLRKGTLERFFRLMQSFGSGSNLLILISQSYTVGVFKLSLLGASLAPNGIGICKKSH